MEQVFEQMQAEILRTVKKLYSDWKSSLMLRPAYWWYVFQRVMVVTVVSVFAFYILVSLWPLSPNEWTRLDWFVVSIFPIRLINLFFIGVIIAVTVIVVIALPISLINFVTFKTLRKFLLVVYLVVLMPAGFGFSHWFVDNLFLQSSLVDYIVYWLGLSNIFSYLITILLMIFKLFTNYIFFFVLGSPINQEQKVFIPSFDQVVFQVIERVKEKAVFKSIYLEHIDTLRGMAQRKQASLGIQSQTVASVVSTFSLFGLVAVLFTQEEVRWLLGEIERWIGPEFSGSIIWIVVFGFLGLTFFPLRYFLRILVALRVLDIVIELLEMRAKELQATTAIDGEFVLQNGIYVPKRGIKHYRSGAEAEKARRV